MKGKIGYIQIMRGHRVGEKQDRKSPVRKRGGGGGGGDHSHHPWSYLPGDVVKVEKLYHPELYKTSDCEKGKMCPCVNALGFQHAVPAPAPQCAPLASPVARAAHSPCLCGPTDARSATAWVMGIRQKRARPAMVAPAARPVQYCLLPVGRADCLAMCRPDRTQQRSPHSVPPHYLGCPLPLQF